MDVSNIQSTSHFQSLVKENDKIVVRCGASWNRAIDHCWQNFDNLMKEFSNLVQLELDVAENEDLALELGVKDVPAYLFFRKGAVAGRYHGKTQTELMERLALLSADQPLPKLEFTRPFRPKQTLEGEAKGQDKPLVLFIAGDRSKVGKSSCCLGLLGSLLKLGYDPSELAYIKPATQCEQPQLVTRFCDSKGITCRRIGPVVFYKGFTREFLKGNVGTSAELLEEIKASIVEIGAGKKFVLVDGVGYPAVGSICGISNADITAKIGAPVLVVGPRGVGHAVDSFNLNACFFESVGTTVLGAVYNRLSLQTDDYYSIDKTREAVDLYFQQYQPSKKVYGYIPEIENLGDARSKSESKSGEDDELLVLASTLVEAFSQHVNVALLVDDLKALQQQRQMQPEDKRIPPTSNNIVPESSKSLSPPSEEVRSKKLSRAEIEGKAKTQGAKGG